MINFIKKHEETIWMIAIAVGWTVVILIDLDN